MTKQGSVSITLGEFDFRLPERILRFNFVEPNKENVPPYLSKSLHPYVTVGDFSSSPTFGFEIATWSPARGLHAGEHLAESDKPALAKACAAFFVANMDR
jgi:hypothetical protein